MGRRAREKNGTWVAHAASEKEEREESLAYFDTVKQLLLEQGADISISQNALDSAAGQANNQGENFKLEGGLVCLRPTSYSTRCRTGERRLGSSFCSRDE
jgi:hypothetical protein